METKSETPAPPTPDAPAPQPEKIVEKENNNTEQDLDLLKEELPSKDPSLEDDLSIFDQKTSEQEEPEVEILPETSFKQPLDTNERKHYEKILKANRETIGSLRKQLQTALNDYEALKANLETTTDK